MIVFNIIPLFGLILAFKNYKVTQGIVGIFTSHFMDFKTLKLFFPIMILWECL